MPDDRSFLVRCFSELDDPREDINKKHLLADIIAITICGVIAGFEGWEDIAMFAQRRQKWFQGFLQLPHGIPSHDTIRRVFLMLDAKRFGKCFSLWMQEIQRASMNKIYALDGKTLRRSFDQAAGKAAIHMISAWAVEEGVSLAQMAVSEKSNEITAYPELLDLLDLQGALVTIDAMGCQTAIAEHVHNKKGEYVLAVKGNQPDLHDQLSDFFVEAERSNFDGITVERNFMTDGDHGRIEERECVVVRELEWLENRARWAGLAAVIMVKSRRKIAGKEGTECRLYITNSSRSAKDLARIIRGHWTIENSQHYVLDVTFLEDQSRKRKDNSAINFAAIRRAALSLLKMRKDKGSIRWKRQLAAMDTEYLEKVIRAER